jgi:hypothetical protein
VPDSTFVLLFAIALFIVAMIVSEALVMPDAGASIIVSISVSVAGYGLYWIVMQATGFTHRFVPTVSCIMACGSILTAMMVFVFLVLKPIVGANSAALVAWLILIWSIPVKGHIIARANEQHWYDGIAIALTIYVMQRFAYDAITATPGS